MFAGTALADPYDMAIGPARRPSRSEEAPAGAGRSAAASSEAARTRRVANIILNAMLAALLLTLLCIVLVYVGVRRGRWAPAPAGGVSLLYRPGSGHLELAASRP